MSAYFATLTGTGYVDTWTLLDATECADALAEARACLGGMTEPRDLRIHLAVRQLSGAIRPLYSRGIDGQPWRCTTPAEAVDLDLSVRLEDEAGK